MMNCPEYSTYIGDVKRKLYNSKPDYRENMSKAMYECQNRPEVKKKKSNSMKKKFKDPEFVNNYIAGITNKSMNKEESLLNDLLQSLYPEYFTYNDKDAFTITGRLAPDFFNEKRKTSIDSFGTFFHSRIIEEQGITEQEYINNRIKRFNDVGWKLLIVWTSIEIKSPEILADRIIKFVEEK